MEGKGVFQHEPCELVPATPIGGGERLDLHSHGRMLPAGSLTPSRGSWATVLAAADPARLAEMLGLLMVALSLLR